MGDQTVIEQSLESQITEEPFVNRQVVYCIDSNNGSYNGQIQIDTSSLSNSGRWASYSEGVLTIPFLITIAAQGANSDTTNYAAGVTAQDADIQALKKSFMVGLKNGYYNLIHSISVEYNNTNVVQLTPYINHYVNYKLLTTLSESDIEKYGTFLGFYPDGWKSADYLGATLYDGTTARSSIDSRGNGAVNNRNLPMAGNAFTRFSDVSQNHYNEGFYKRCMNCTAFDPSANASTNDLKGRNKLGHTTTRIINNSNLGYIGKNFYDHQATTNNDVFYILAQIRLKDIADFFDKMPLTRGAYLRFLINTNTATTTVGYQVTTAKTNYNTVSLADGSNRVNGMIVTSNTVTGGTNPLLIASAEGTDDAITQTSISTTGHTETVIAATLNRADAQRAQGGNIFSQHGSISLEDADTDTLTLAGVAAGSNTTFYFTFRSSIVTDTTLGKSHPVFSNTRLYVPLYTMTNEEVARYLSVQPVKNMAYRDVFQYSINVDANGSFNSLLTNGVANPKSLIVIPYYQNTSNYISYSGAYKNAAGTAVGGSGDANYQANATSVFQSPFASEPGTTSLYAALRDFNVQLSGVNVYSQNILYDFEMFKNEVSRTNAINGGLVDGLTSGLISYDQWNANMRYYVVDLSRRIKAEDAVPKSIQISGTNASSVALTLFIYLEYEKSVSIALDSGSLLS